MDPKFYISPYSGRVIKSSGKLFHQLQDEGFIVDKHKCFYNIKTAERCLNKLLTLYPYIAYPPSRFIGIPRTYKKGPARAFVCDNENNVVGIVDKTGTLKQLQTPVPKQDNSLEVKDPLNVLPSVLPKKEIIDQETQTEVEKQLQEKEETPQVSIIYNPVQDDFIPINKETNVEEQKEIIQVVNQELVPLQLPPIKEDGNVSGAIVNKESTQLLGIIDTSNQIKAFREPIDIEPIDEKTENLDTASETDKATEESESDTDTESEESDVSESEIESDTDTEESDASEIELQTSDKTSESVNVTDTEGSDASESEIEPSVNETETESDKATDGTEESEIEPSVNETETESDKATDGTEESEIETETESDKATEESDKTTEESDKTTEESDKTNEGSDSDKATEESDKATEESDKTNEGSDTDKTTEGSDATKSEIETEKIRLEGIPMVSVSVSEAETIPSESEKEIIEQLDVKCLDGEQYEVNSKRCLPCTYYNLIWDSETKKCRVDLKRNIVVTDKDGNIMGYL
jgi:hypothetical protein